MKSRGAIFCVGRNYSEHAKELGNPIPSEPIIFLKLAQSLRPLQWQGKRPFPEETFHHEVELVLKIAKDVALGSEVRIDEVVKEVAVGIDLTRRTVQKGLKEKGYPWTTAKSFDGSALLGPFVETKNIATWPECELSLHVNQQLRQKGKTADMLFSFGKILQFILQFHTLREGDYVYTGTPAGVGECRYGDRLQLGLNEMSWEGIL